jgi:hypothetical protein
LFMIILTDAEKIVKRSRCLIKNVTQKGGCLIIKL